MGTFTAAFLLIVVQPAITSFLLPRTGGHPYLWHASQVCFLMLLMIGYGLVQVGLERWSLRRIAVGIAFIGCIAILPPPLMAAKSVSVPGAITTLIVVVGPIFLMLATVSIGAQMTYVAISGRANPYWLYSASNLGSLAAAYMYVFAVEPNFDISAQITAWRASAGLLLLAIACALIVWSRRQRFLGQRFGRSTVRERLSWVLGGLWPVGLSLTCTSYLTVVFGAQPAVWLAPFAAYLTTLVLAFTDRGRVVLNQLARAMPAAGIIVTTLLFYPLASGGWLFASHVVLVGVLMAGWNAWLASRRPEAAQLPSFYRNAAFGGLIASLLVSLAAPVALDPALYPASVVAGLRPVLATTTPEYIVFAMGGVVLAQSHLRVQSLWMFVLVEACALGAAVPLGARALSGDRLMSESILAVVAVSVIAVTVFRIRTRLQAAVCAAAAIVVSCIQWNASDTVAYWTRSAFGQVVISDRSSQRVLTNGLITHGVQPIDCAKGYLPIECVTPTSYYAHAGPLGIAMRVVREQHATIRLGVVGLGAGTVAAYCRAGDSLTFYEIDPKILGVAERFFRFLEFARANCGGLTVAVGDGRLLAQHQLSGAFELFVMDAFTSDSIPTHLLTKEGLRDFARITASTGVLAVHVSNRYFDLAPVVTAAVRGTGLGVIAVSDRGGADRYSSSWVLASQSERTVARLRAELFERDEVGAPAARPRKSGFVELGVSHTMQAWSDERHSLLEALRK